MTTPTVPVPARRAAAREHSAAARARARTLATVSRLAAATALLATLSACGGGGGGGGGGGDTTTPPPPAPTPSPSPTPSGPIAAQMSVPTPVGYDTERLAAFNRLNEIRLSAGLGMVAQNTLMDQAAQAHADWMIANDAFVHTEVAGTRGFTGADWWSRDELLGYVPVGGAEEMSSGVDPVTGVSELINGVYHRAGLLAFEPVDVGVGWSAGGSAGLNRLLVIDVSRPGIDLVRSKGQATQESIRGVAIWPLDQATGVATHLGFEVPNPVPTQDVSMLGSPASLMVSRLQTLQITSFSMTNMRAGSDVSTVLLTSQSDPNSLIPSSFAAIIPLVALDAGTTYRVVFRGSAVTFPSGEVMTIDRTWTFSTSSR